MTTHKEALTLALEALNTNRVMAKDSEGNYTREITPKLIVEAITAIKKTLAQPEQPKVRTGDCLLVGVCASEGHKIQKAQPEQEPVAHIPLKALEQLKPPMLVLNNVPVYGYSAEGTVAVYTTPPQPKEPEQEPVAKVKRNSAGQIYIEWRDGEGAITSLIGAEFYTTPPQRTWVGLTDVEIASACKKNGGAEWWWRDIEEFAKAIEAKLKEKNNA